MRVFYLRNSEQLDDVTSTSVFPGIPSPWHSFLAYDSALVYCSIHKPERVPFILSRAEKREKQIMRFIAHRNPDDNKIMTTRNILFH